MPKRSENKFYIAYVTVIMAIGTFFILKEFLPQKLFTSEVVATDGIVIDSLALIAMNEGAEVENVNINIDSTRKVNVIPIRSSQYSEGYGYLHQFFEKLYRIESQKVGKVRIGYFSDSMTDGDLIVQDIRKEYQKKFGGKGVGFVGITSLSAGSRGSVSHMYSKNWNNQSFLKTKNPTHALGIDGQVAIAPAGASTWISYIAGKNENSTALYRPTLFYGESTNTNASMSIRLNKDSILTEQLYPTQLLNTYKVEGAPNSVRIDFNNAGSIPFYGINFDDGRGVHVDNFSMRGNSGLPLATLNIPLMNAFDEVLHYDLIILHYGANVLHQNTKSYTWFKNSMQNIVTHLRECFPDADILIISTADKSDRVEGVMRTSKALPILLDAQREAAENTGSGFINLYELMGGYGSMVNWVNNKPALANKDYTHFSIRGAQKIGALIYSDLNKGYQEYKKTKYGIDYIPQPAISLPNSNESIDDENI